MRSEQGRAHRRACLSPRLAAACLAWAVGTLLPAARALAADKTDVVVFTNGDRLTGEVKELSQGRLTFDTNATGEIKIEWDKVASLESRQWLHIETSSGARYFGRVAKPVAPATLVVAKSDRPDATPRTLPLADVVGIAPIEQGELFDRLKGYVTAGYDYTKANDLQTFSFSGGLKLRDERRQWSIDGDSNITSQAGSNDSQRFSLTAGYRWFLPERRFLQGFASLEGNDQLGLDLRSTVGTAYGRYMQQTNSRDWVVYGGFAVTEENFAGQKNQGNLEGLLGTQYSFYRYDTPKASLDFTLNLIPSLTDFGRYRSDTSLSSRYEIVSDLFFEISLYGTFDSDPGDEAESNSDYGVVTSLGYSF